MRIQIFQLLLNNLTKGDSSWPGYTLPSPIDLLYSFTSPVQILQDSAIPALKQMEK